jgi:hypothetical protein
MKTFCTFVVSAGLMIVAPILSSCRHTESSPIITAFQNAGGGDVGHATPGSISAFLAQLTLLCKQKQAGAPADWATTDEGKVCAANTSANFFAKPTLKSDGVAF